MAIRIEEQKTEIPVIIGKLEFSFKVTDEAILEFRKNGLAIAEELQNLQAGGEESLDRVKEVLRKGFDLILGEGAFDKLYDMTPSVVVLMKYFEQLAAGLTDELNAIGAFKAIDRRAQKYLK